MMLSEPLIAKWKALSEASGTDQTDPLVPRLCLGTNALQALPAECFVYHTTRGRASGAVRSQTEPANEKHSR